MIDSWLRASILFLVLFSRPVFSEEVIEDPRELQVSAILWAEGHNEFEPTLDNILDKIRLGRDLDYLFDLLTRFKPLNHKREIQVLDLILDVIRNPESPIRTDRLISLFSRVPISQQDTLQKIRLIMKQSLPFETKHLAAYILTKLEFSSEVIKKEAFFALQQVALNPDAHAETRILSALHLIEADQFVTDAEFVLTAYLRRPKSAHFIFLNASFEESIAARISDRLVDEMSAALALFKGTERDSESWRLEKIRAAKAKWDVDCSAGLIELGLLPAKQGRR